MCWGGGIEKEAGSLLSGRVLGVSPPPVRAPNTPLASLYIDRTHTEFPGGERAEDAQRIIREKENSRQY